MCLKKEPLVVEKYADNGEHSHYALIDVDTGLELWSEENSKPADNNKVDVITLLQEIRDRLERGHAQSSYPLYKKRLNAVLAQQQKP